MVFAFQKSSDVGHRVSPRKYLLLDISLYCSSDLLKVVRTIGQWFFLFFSKLTVIHLTGIALLHKDGISMVHFSSTKWTRGKAVVCIWPTLNCQSNFSNFYPSERSQHVYSTGTYCTRSDNSNHFQTSVPRSPSLNLTLSEYLVNLSLWYLPLNNFLYFFFLKSGVTHTIAVRQDSNCLIVKFPFVLIQKQCHARVYIWGNIIVQYRAHIIHMFRYKLFVFEI